MKILGLCATLLLLFGYATAQNPRMLDSLQKMLATNISDKQRVDIYNLIAHEYSNSDSVEVAHYTTASISLAKKAAYPAGISDAWYQLGWITMRKGHALRALVFFEHTLQAARKVGYKKGEANAYNGKGAIYRRQSNYPKALELFRQSLKLREEVNDNKGVAGSYGNIGIVYHDQGNYPKAIDFFKVSLRIKKKIGDKKGIAYTYNNMGEVYNLQGNYPKALELYQRSLKINTQMKDKWRTAINYYNIGEIYREQGNYPKAMKFFQKSLRIREQIKDKAGIAGNFISIGLIHHEQNNYLRALEFFERSLQINTQIGSKSGIAGSNLSLGKLALARKQYTQAKVHFEKALTMRQHMGEKDLSAEAQVNLGIAHYVQKEYKEAQSYLEKGLQAALNTGNPHFAKEGAEYLTKVYQATGKYKKALENHVLFKKMTDSLLNAKNIRQVTRLEDKQREDSLQLIQSKLEADIEKRKLTQRTTYLGLGLSIVFVLVLLFFYRSKQHSNRRLSEANEEISQQQEELQAQHAYLEHTYQSVRLLTTIGQEITASLDLDKVLETIYEHVNKLMDATNFGIGIYEPENQQIVFKLAIVKGHRKDEYVLDTQNKDQVAVWCVENNQPVVMGDIPQEYHKYVRDVQTEGRLLIDESGFFPYSAMCIPLIIQKKTIGLLTVHSHLKHAYTNYQLDLLKNLSLYVATAIDHAQVYEQLDEKNQDMLAGISYARRIQRAILPLDADMQQHLPEHFVLYRPRDIVSGDFYWCEAYKDKVFVVAGDCTGHGVPGAFMTMLGIQALNHIMVQNKVHTPDLVLFCLECILQQILKIDNTRIRDGMDIALLVLDKQKKELQYAGARSSLLMIQDNEMREIKGSLYSINGYRPLNKGIEFTTYTIDVSEPTMLYMYSDGYQDQFGGSKSKKFMKPRLNKLLFDGSPKPVEEQKLRLENTLNKWMNGHEQIDDILVMGIRI